jgi:YegS/Rv2252/BmrU family lipid kinase
VAAWQTWTVRLRAARERLARWRAVSASVVAGERLRATGMAVADALRRLTTAASALYLVLLGGRAVAQLTERASLAAEGQRVRPQVRIIANPVAGGLHGAAGLRELQRTVEWLAGRGLPAELCLTDGAGSARRLAEEAVAAGLPMVVAAGGDGTINEVLQALAGHTTALGVLPLGTVNIWAREAGIPLMLAEARRVLVEGVRQQVDLGRAGRRHFLLMAGIGVDAEVARRVERHVLKRLGLKLLDYFTTSGVVGATQRPVKVWLRRDDGRRHSRRILQIVIGNTRLHSGVFTFTQRAVADDGLLDVVSVGGRGMLDRARVLIRALLRRRSLGPHTHYERVRSIHIDSEQPLPVQVDGEVIGKLPMTFAVCPRALTVILPRREPPDLFAHAPLDN